LNQHIPQVCTDCTMRMSRCDSFKDCAFCSKLTNQSTSFRQYCGSCWAHGALSSLADRINIAQLTSPERGQSRDEINLSIQYILNCGANTAGSCHGGSSTGVYQFIQSESGFVPYDTCMPYIACSADSTNGFCPHLEDRSCSPLNTCRTCDGTTGQCHAIHRFPNATIAEYGTYSYYTGGMGAVAHKIKAEIYARGPVAAAINADPILNYKGGIVNDTSIWHMMVNHIVSIVGWGTTETTGEQYWEVRNSWGQYYGSLGYFKILMGHNALGIESEIAWATPGSFTVENYPCDENGDNCVDESTTDESVGPTMMMMMRSHHYQDPSLDPVALQQRRRLQQITVGSAERSFWQNGKFSEIDDFALVTFF
jgi:cathepsin X